MADAPPPGLSLAVAASAPWLAAPRERLVRALGQSRLSHAVMLQGGAGLGKRALAEWIARLVLCERGETAPCGACPGCVLVAAGSHPDLYRVGVAEDKKQVAVEDVRELIAALSLKSQRGRRKVAIIDPADMMNASGANALLKTLEEPSGDALLLLTVSRPERLPATIASRCQRVKIVAPAREAALAWLASVAPGADVAAALDLTGGAPFAALALAEGAQIAREMTDLPGQLARPDADIVALAERCQQRQPAERLRWIENWVTERIRKGLLAPATDHTPASTGLPADLRRRHIQGLYRVLDETRLAQSALRGSANVAMLFERLFVMLARELELLRSGRTRG